MTTKAMWLITSIPPKNFDNSFFNIELWSNVGVQVYTINSQNEAIFFRGRISDEDIILSDRSMESLYGRPLIGINDALKAISKIAPEDAVIGIVNSDIFPNNNLDWLAISESIRSDEMMIHKRTDFKRVPDSDEMDFQPISYEYGYDLFLLKNNSLMRNLIEDDSGDLAYGVPWWDYWFPFKAIKHGFKINVYENCSIFHEVHKEQFSQDLWHKKGEELRDYLKKNQEIISKNFLVEKIQNSCLIDLCRLSVRYLDSLKFRSEKIPFLRNGISIITACMNRNENLAKALSTWIKADEVDEIVIVDWSSDVSVRSTLVENNIFDSRVRVIRKDNEPVWNLCRAYNFGFENISFSNVLKLDADVCIDDSFFVNHELIDDIYYSGSWRTAKNDDEKRLNGSFYSKTELFYLAGGYNEVIDTYGWDDSDLYSRFKKLSHQYDFKVDHIFHLQQTEESRIENSKKNLIFDSLSVSVFTELEIKKNQWKSYFSPPKLPFLDRNYGDLVSDLDEFFYKKTIIFFLEKSYSDIGLGISHDMLSCLSLNALHDLFVFRHNPVSWRESIYDVYWIMSHIPFQKHDNSAFLSNKESPFLKNKEISFFPEVISSDFSIKIPSQGCNSYEGRFYKDSIKEKSYGKSVTIPVVLFNADDFIDSLLVDIKKQTVFYDCLFVFIIADKRAYRNVERFCSDNADNTTFVYFMYDPGLYDCWNYVAALTLSPYISNWNADDRRSAKHIEKLLYILENKPEYSAVCSALFVSRSANKTFELCENDHDEKWFSECRKEFNHTDMFQKQLWLKDDDPKRENIISQNFLHCMPIWRASLHSKYGFFDENKYGASADWEFWLRCGLGGEYYFQTDEVLGVYFLNEQSYGRATSGVLEKEAVIKNEYFKYSNLFIEA